MDSHRAGSEYAPWTGNGATEKAALISCLVILVLKVLLVWRLNVNWDEFFFLSHVHDLARGDLTLVFQSLHTHLFRWLVTLGGDEMREIIAGRLVMAFLLATTILLIWKLASRWTSPSAAALAALTYATMSSTLKHGGSFRADSLLVPLVLLSLLVFTEKPKSARNDLTSGALLGLATAVTIKAALAGPIFIALVLFGDPGQSVPRYSLLRAAILRLARFALATGAITAVLTGAHWLALTSAPRETAGGFALRSARTTLIDVSFIPQAGFLRESLASDAVAWSLIAAGMVLALVEKRRLVLAFGLALLPILVYRNSFPYYYPVMLAPACVLTAIAFDALRGWTDRRWGNAAQNGTLGATICLLLLVGFIHVAQLWRDEQQAQREVVAAVHQIFPEPVPYIDHSGMIASFPKVNFFMSGWGLQSYRQKGIGFMPRALETRHPAFVLSNRPVLEPAHPAFQRLLPEDREIIDHQFVPYWGPIRVAGAEGQLPEDGTVDLRLPFPGRYRLESEEPVLIDGHLQRGGDVLFVRGRIVRAARSSGPHNHSEIAVRLILATANPAPNSRLPKSALYTGL